MQNMDDHASSDGASSTERFEPSCTSSTQSVDFHRPRQPRQHSDTHVFPANQARPTQGMRSAKSRAALRELLNPKMLSLGTDDRTQLLNSGLQWLLETSTTRSSVPLSHEAVGTFNSSNKRADVIHGEIRNDTGLGTQSTKTWLDDQVNAKALPPW